MKNFKRLLLHSFVIASVCLCAVSISSGMAAKTNVKTKKIVVSEGEKHIIKIKKGSKITNNNKKVAKISKKGVITGVKKGKCVINICHKNKLLKYKVTVKELKKQDTKEYNSKEKYADNDPSGLVNGGPGSPILKTGYYIEKIEPKDDKTSYIYMSYDPKDKSYNENSPIKYTVIEIYNDRIKYNVGEYTCFFVNYDAGTEVVGDTIYYKSDINQVSLTR